MTLSQYYMSLFISSSLLLFCPGPLPLSDFLWPSYFCDHSSTKVGGGGGGDPLAPLNLILDLPKFLQCARLDISK